MGLLKGALTFSRFRLTDRLTEPFLEHIDRQIRKFAFRDPPKSPDEKTLGWTGMENVLDTDFRHPSYILGDYLLFSLRIDRRMIPPSLFRLRTLEAEKRYLAEKGQKKIDRHRREDIRERVRLGLLDQIQPVPSFYDLCWSLSGRWLLFTSLSDKVVDDFQDLFKRSFDLLPCPFVPWDPQFMEPGPAAIPASPEEDLKQPGRAFLTWLWYKSEAHNGRVTLPDGSEVEVIFTQRLVLESGDGEYAESVVCRGLHADLMEGREALRQGKKIKEARLKLSRDEASWEFTFKADRFRFQSLKLPLLMDDEEGREDVSGRVLERLYLVETAVRTMDQLFSLFLALRLSPQWRQEQSRMDHWLKPGTKGLSAKPDKT